MATASATRTLENIFTCCLCFEPYNTTENIPKALPCQHTFCAPCLNKLICAVNENGEEPQCPKCKAGFSVPREGARKLPTNLSVQQMIELKMHQATPPLDSVEKPGVILTHRTCEEHAGKHVIMVCVECEIEFCIDCMKTLHMSKHSKHALEDIETYLSNYKNYFERLKKCSQMLPDRYHQAQKAAGKSVGNTKRERENEIDQLAQNAIRQVQTWQKKQKNVTYRQTYQHSFHGRDVNVDAIKRFSSKIDKLGNFECKTLPSIKGIQSAVFELGKLEGKCTNLGRTIYEKPPIEPIEVVIGKQQK